MEVPIITPVGPHRTIAFMTRTTSIAAAAALSGILFLTACSADGEPTTPAPAPPASATSSESTGPSSPSGSPESPTPGQGDDTSPAPSADDRPLGLTDRQFGEPTRINKAIARCATRSEGLYEQGTTWFTDGTTGWTTYCSNRYNDGPPPASTPGWTPDPAEGGPAPAGNEPAPSYGDGGKASHGDGGTVY